MLGRVVSRTILGLKRPERMRLLAALRPQEWQSPEQIAARSRTAQTAILRHACARVPYYQEFCAQAGIDPGAVTADDLPRFPLVSKKAMREDGPRFHDAHADRSRFIPSSTGGSSGEPFRFFVDAAVSELRIASDLRARTWAGWRLGDKQVLFWGHLGDLREARSLRGRIKANLVHRQISVNAYGMQEEALDGYRRVLAAFGPRLLLGYASALAFFAEYVRRSGVPFPTPAGIISGAETLTDEFREAIESCFACPVLNRYGSRELAMVAQQCSPRSGLHVFSDRVHVEVLRPDGTACEAGERGEIVATDLDNRVMPFIRYRTGDLAVPAAGTCSCGRGYPLLATVEGRTSEVIVGRNGRYYSCPGPRLYGGDIPGIGRMQLIQDRVEAITVRVVPDAAWSDDSHTRLVAHIRGLLGDVEVIVDLVNDIPPSPSGKYRFTISTVSPFHD